MLKIMKCLHNMIISDVTTGNLYEIFITLRLKVCIGRLRVSPMCLFFGSLGLLQSVRVNFQEIVITR